MKFNPQGNIVATGEDGVPWELYENGYLLFKPTKEKDTLTNSDPSPYWKEKYGEHIIAIGFTGEVYAPEDSSFLFSKYNKNIDCKLTKLQYVETYKLNTSNVTDMSSMFACSIVESLDLSNWNTSKVTDMSSMFNGTSGLQDLNIGKWDTSNVINMYHIFNGASKLQFLNIENWDMSKGPFLTGFLIGNDNLQLLDCSKMTSTHNNIKDFFTRNIGLGNINLPDDCVVLF